MNYTEYGNIAIGAEGSTARAQANEKFLAEKICELVFVLNEMYELIPYYKRHNPTLIQYKRIIAETLPITYHGHK